VINSNKIPPSVYSVNDPMFLKYTQLDSFYQEKSNVETRSILAFHAFFGYNLAN
jgi:hypothetical protein